MHSHHLRTMIGLLELIRACDGVMEGRVRVQKVAFLLGAKGVENFDPEDFVYHYHGPYSRALSDVLHQAVSFGLVQEKRESFSDDMVRYSYEISPSGQEFLDAADSKSELTALAKSISDCNWRSLELAATVVFLEKQGSSNNRDESFAKSVKLKPDCISYENEAREVLRSVGL